MTSRPIVKTVHLEILFPRCGAEMHLTKDVLVAVAFNEICGQGMMEILLQTCGAELHFTERAILGMPHLSTSFFNNVLANLGKAFQVSSRCVEHLASHCRLKVIFFEFTARISESQRKH
jgi:hypothetical protein